MIFKRFKLTKRRWNNILIIAISAFMLLMAAPNLIKQYLIEQDVEPQVLTGLVLDPNASPIEINYAGIQFYLDDETWHAIPEKWTSDAASVIQRWRAIQGTPVDEKTYAKLKPVLENPMTVEVWYQEKEEPQRITAYQLEKFWLLNTYDENWVAVSFEASSLIPTESNQ
ncbi:MULTISPECIES: hypothetical protein [Vibrio]|uniref:50S ribosomal protein L33 n=2 Tax=Vibrio mediterranei TaxID=689 RepID=A0A2S9ZK18_9VIBR|nr:MULTISPECIES: hypothetical protein [Vibrio]AYV21591.1 hypothetical protein ECB94_10120 [Vibrio mediterranei]MCG9656318.1 hypothetical protein [Vibrio mediterranei]MCG9665463.1 hypothetical protein [Vibrio mediterranei]MCY9854953.1 hypothetical protein [Vibrio mediterranei]MDA0110931.1 hypothetical protein [Vibrio sp. La 4.2.2]